MGPPFTSEAMAMRRRRQQRPEVDGVAELLADGERLDEGGHDEEGEQQLALEDGEQGEFQGPVRRPTSLGPTTPLFSPEQLRDLREVQSQAPHLYAKMPRESVWRPGGEVQDQVQPPQQSTTRELHLLSLAKDMIFGNLKEADHRISKSRKWKSQKRAMKTELDYKINLRFKHEAMDRNTKNVISLQGMAKADLQGM